MISKASKGAFPAHAWKSVQLDLKNSNLEMKRDILSPEEKIILSYNTECLPKQNELLPE